MIIGKQHLQQVDYIRCFASLSVVLYHLGGKAVPILNYGWLGVEMFFVLSGFIICYSIPNNYTLADSIIFISRRLLRIEPPYIISIVVILIVNFLAWGFKPDWINIAFHLAYLNNFFARPYINPVYWTLGIEFQFYLVIAFLFPLILKPTGKWYILLICLISAFLSFEIFNLTVVRFVPLFSLGMFVFLYQKKLIKTLEFLFFIGFTILILIYVFNIWIALVGLASAIILSFPLKAHPAITFFSKISFSLYLTHDIIGSNLVIYISSILPKNVIFSSLAFCAGLLVSIGFAFLFYAFVEKRFLMLSKSIAYQKQPQNGILRTGDMYEILK